MATWRQALLPVLAVLLWVAAWYWSTGAAMVEIWSRSETFAHGFVVSPIALWLIWRKRAELASLSPAPSLGWLALLAMSGLGWLLGMVASVNPVAQVAFTAMLVLTVPCILGSEVASRIAFPLGFMFFAVPIGEFLLPTLMQWTADFTIFALRLSGIPVYREGLQFVIPSGHWSVVEACGGVRYLIASLMVGTLFAYVSYRSLRRRLLFMCAAILVPIVANWLRAYMIVMLGHVSGNKLAVGVDHLIYGWVFFGIVITLMFWVGARWREDPPETAQKPADWVAGERRPLAPRFWQAALAVALVTVPWPLALNAIERSDVSAPARLGMLPDVAGWTVSGEALAAWEPRFVNPSDTLQGTYRRNDREAGLFIGYYRGQDRDRKLVSSENVLVASNDRHWHKVAEDTRDFDVGGREIPIRVEELAGREGERLVAVRWYWIDGHVTASDYRAKIYLALTRLQGRGDDGAVIVIYAPKQPASGSIDAVDAFVRDAAPAIDAMLNRVREAR